MVHKAVCVETRETEEEDGEGVKVLSAIFAFFPLIFYTGVDRHRSSLVGESYLKQKIGFLLIPAWISHPFLVSPFVLISSPFCGPSGWTDAVFT